VGGGALRCVASYSSCLNPSLKLPDDAVTGTFRDRFLVVSLGNSFHQTLDQHVMTEPFDSLDSGWRPFAEDSCEFSRESTVRRRSEAALS